VAALLPRLTRFGVRGSIVRVCPKQVFEIFDCVPSQLNIKELELPCCDVEDDHVDQFLDLINKMPCLQRLEARVPFSIVHGIQTLSKLEKLSLIKRSNLFEDEAAVVEFLRPFASSKLGGNLNFLVGGLTYSLVAFLKQSKLLGLGILRVFESAGFTSKNSIQTTAEILRHVEDEPNAFDTFFKVLCSNRHPLLPLTAELQPIAAEILNSVVSHLPESSLKLLIETFGPMKTNPYSASTRLMTYPDRGAHLFELGLLSMDDLIHPKRDADNLFSFVTTEEQLEWLLSIMSKNDALRLLCRRAAESEDSSCPVIRLLSMDPCVSILSKWFEGLPIFVFDDAKERLSAYCSANSKSTVNLLFRHNADCMSNQDEGCILWHLCLCADVSEAVFNHWLKFLATPLLIDASQKYRKMITSAFKASASSAAVEENLISLFFNRGEDFRYQASQLQANGAFGLIDLLSALADWIETISKPYTSPSTADGGTEEPNEDMEFIIERIFAHFVEESSFRNESPIRVMTSRLEQWRRPTGPVVKRLFDICATFDFTGYGMRYESHRLFAAFIVKHLAKLEHDALMLVQNWLDKINPLAMNEIAPGGKFSAFEAILRKEVVRKLVNIVDLIQRLVQRGCRLSNPHRTSEYCTLYADKEALELYFEAERFAGPPEETPTSPLD
jgi:hypothetical protein